MNQYEEQLDYLIDEEIIDLDEDDIRRLFLHDEFPSYFCCLNVKYNTTANQINSQFKKIQDLYYHRTQNQYKLNNGEIVTKGHILDQIKKARRYLTDELFIVEYFWALEVRYLANQLLTLDMINQYNCGRIYPFVIFPVSIKKRIGSATVWLRFDFINQVLEEKKDGFILRAIHFRSINHCIPSFSPEEFTLNFTYVNKEVIILYQCIFTEQRDLLIEVINLAIDVSRHVVEQHSKFIMINPNIKIMEEQTKKKNKNKKDKNEQQQQQQEIELQERKQTLQNILSTKLTKLSILKVSLDDRVMPPRVIKQAIVTKKGSIFNKGQMVFLTIGLTQLIISSDYKVQQLISVYPLVEELFKCSLARETASIAISFGQDKNMFRFRVEEEALNFYFLINFIMRKKFTYQLQLNDEYPHSEPSSYIYKIRKALIKIQQSELKMQQDKMELLNQEINLLNNILQSEKNIIITQRNLKKTQNQNPHDSNSSISSVKYLSDILKKKISYQLKQQSEDQEEQLYIQTLKTKSELDTNDPDKSTANQITQIEQSFESNSISK